MTAGGAAEQDHRLVPPPGAASRWRHGHPLPALVKHLDRMSEEAVLALNIPTGIPLVYELDDALQPLKSFYLGDPEASRKAAEAVAKQGKA